MSGRNDKTTSFQTLCSAVSPIMIRIAAARQARLQAATNSNSPDVLRGAVRCDEREKARQR